MYSQTVLPLPAKSNYTEGNVWEANRIFGYFSHLDIDCKIGFLTVFYSVLTLGNEFWGAIEEIWIFDWPGPLQGSLCSVQQEKDGIQGFLLLCLHLLRANGFHLQYISRARTASDSDSDSDSLAILGSCAPSQLQFFFFLYLYLSRLVLYLVASEKPSFIIHVVSNWH